MGRGSTRSTGRHHPFPTSEKVPDTSVGATALNIKFIVLFLHSRPNPRSQRGSAEGRIFTVPACLPAKLPPLNPQSISLWSAETQLGTRAEEKWKSPLENRRKRLENLIPPPSHTLGEQRSANSPCHPARVSWGREEDVGNSSTAGLAASGARGGGRRLGQQHGESFLCRSMKGNFSGAKKERP